MSSHTPEKLAYMVNQIARNLALDPDPVGMVAQHIQDFWTPRMKHMAFALDGAELDPVAREALARLAGQYAAAAAS
ncbi:formate dehydrogenase subunit delta [Novosphingobium sp. NBM11]|uniref:formate dehydrogenase subunit delta n=1 Tax=Novosphingobium sp. NBM11 TaxID=2596914 RepID=UPI0021077473|nr:formate dehydrogenase subunit delta [Novosphingobium sp. NBM11]